MSETMTLEWTGKDLEEARRREVLIFFHGTSHEEMRETKGLPSDLHLVEYELNGETHFDGVRSYKMVNIFDIYYDKLKSVGGKVIAIRSGYGSVKPNMFNPQSEDSKEKKKK